MWSFQQRVAVRNILNSVAANPANTNKALDISVQEYEESQHLHITLHYYSPAQAESIVLDKNGHIKSVERSVG